MLILGLSAYYHDSAAALIHDGEIVAAAQEERFLRHKHYAGFPVKSVQYCLSEAGVGLDEIALIAFYEKPFLKFERLLETYHTFAPRGIRSFMAAMPVWLRGKLFHKSLLRQGLEEALGVADITDRLLFTEHHLSHAASAFYPSPFDKALILTMDGVGEWPTTSVMLGEDNHIQPLKEIHFPHSLGLLYSAFTYFTGFKVNSDEYKMMGLAPYGHPIYADIIKRHLIDIRDDGSFSLDMRYFNYCTGLTMTSKRFHKLFGRSPRSEQAPITQLDMDLARSIQQITEEVLLKIAATLKQEYDIPNLCLAGGVALNSVANGRLVREGPFDHVWIQPAAGDAGGAVGTALAAYHQYSGGERPPRTGRDGMRGSLLGPAYTDEDIRSTLDAIGAAYSFLDEDALVDDAAHAIADGAVIGWFQGRMEFGPRALGARSILGDPRSPETQAIMNLKTKYRESFRPFAPAVLREDVSEYFDFDGDSPYMLLVAPVSQHRWRQLTEAEQAVAGLDQVNIPRSDIPAVTHVDYSARLQTVAADDNPLFYSLICRFKAITGFGLVVNTSFNVRGEPIVCTPRDALRCFMKTSIDTLYLGSFKVAKPAQRSDLLRRLE